MSTRSALVNNARAVLPPQPIQGYVDTAEDGIIDGWANGQSHGPGRPLEIEVHAEDGGLIASSMADLFRADLLSAGIGDGRHAFSVHLPHLLAGGSRLRLRVKVKGTDVYLPYAPTGTITFESSPPAILQFIAADIVNNCNLRCPFCLVDYRGVTKTEVMSEDTFSRLLTLIRSVRKEGFWLSCLHEPTLHPHLNKFLAMVPEDCRKRVWFTTNLAKPLTEKDFIEWAESGMHHINVSLDSMNPELFAILRKFGRYHIFKRNLDLMADVFRRYPHPPKLRYITMAFRSNFDEIANIVRHSNEHWLSSENEIRYTFNVTHITDEFQKEHYMYKEDWPRLSEVLAKVPYHHVITYPPEEEEVDRPMSANYFDLLQLPEKPKEVHFDRPISLRARPDGTLLIPGRESQWSVNIHDLEDPVSFFRNL